MEPWSRLKRSVVVLGGIGGALGLLAFTQRPTASPVTSDSASAAAPDTTVCRETFMHARHDSVSTAVRRAAFKDCLRRIGVVRALGAEAERLSQLNLLIPEFHDEQRFASSPAQYGPTVMGFASPNLAGFVHEGQWNEHGARGVLSAIVYVDPDDTSPQGEAYTRLGLQQGINCIWIARDPATRVVWSAYVTWSAPNTACSPDNKVRDLAVVRSQPLGRDAPIADYPPATRFTWDSRGLPLIGVRCLSGWCDLGPRDDRGNAAFSPYSAIGNALATTPGLRTELLAILGDLTAVQVLGWHDEQYLSEVRVVGTDTILVPGRVLATVIPIHRAYTTMDALTRAGSASDVLVYVHGGVSASRYGRPGWNLRNGLNRIYFGSATPTTFYATLDPASTGPRWNHFERHAHFDAAVISTARFRWASLDESIWIACGQACCRVDGEM